MTNDTLRPRALAVLLLSVVLCASATAAEPGELADQVAALLKRVDTLEADVKRLTSQNEALVAQQERQDQRIESAETAPPSQFENLSIWGYGETYYARPDNGSSETTADLARAVFGLGYRFDERTRFDSEFEVEHAVASADDEGEVEVEQFYVDHNLTDRVGVEAGLFLMPVGLLNEHHEPTAFYGVKRNFVETLIVPSTWREGGIGIHGDTAGGIVWNAGVTTGLDFSGWEFTLDEPPYKTALELVSTDVAPMQAGHQELQLADAQHLAQYAMLAYRGLPGLEVGAFAFTGNAAVPDAPANAHGQRVTLLEGHVRWTPGDADLSALYARGTISDTGAYNLANVGASNLMPASFDGYYVQGAYTVWRHNAYRLVPFARWESYDMASSYHGVPDGFSPIPTGPTATGEPWPRPNDRVWTFGANFYVTSNVVVKADYQWFDNNDFDTIDLGLGVTF